MGKHSVILLNSFPDKKIKSIGNRCLIELKNNKNVLDYHMSTINTIFKNPEIILVCGFDNKKIKKYIQSKYKNIIYVEHEMNDLTNIGHSVSLGLKTASKENCLILNSNILLHGRAISSIKNNLDKSFVVYSDNKGNIGILHSKNKLINCYYDLPNNLFDILYINQKEFKYVSNIKNMSSLYFFEIINQYIDTGMTLLPLKINENSITIINCMKNIEKVKKRLCSI